MKMDCVVEASSLGSCPMLGCRTSGFCCHRVCLVGRILMLKFRIGNTVI
jgi:hypothetical protein